MKHLFLILLGVLSLIGCGATPTPVAFSAPQYAGTYEGTWTNSATGASGPARIIIETNEATHSANLTIDFDGNYLGLDNPPPMTLTGTYDAAGAKVKGTSPLFGDYDVTIDPAGKIVGVMKQLAMGAIPEMTYTGQLTADRLDADYLVKFADGKTVNSILRMEKVRK